MKLPILEISAESLAKMQDLIDNPPPPSAELRKAYERYKKYCSKLPALPKYNKDKT